MKKAGAALCLFVIAFLFFSCDMPVGGYEYTFENKTPYTITITILNKAFKNSKDEDTEKRGSFSLKGKSSHTIYVEADSVDFQWTANESKDNRNIYAARDGSTVTFKPR